MPKSEPDRCERCHTIIEGKGNHDGQCGDCYILDDSTCISCGGEMEWCTTCDMWSATCCEEYGTCECS